MANERLTASRAMPRAVAQSFFENRYLTVMSIALLAAGVISLTSVVQGVLAHENAIYMVLNGLGAFLNLFVGVRLNGLRTRQTFESTKSMSRICLVYCCVQAFLLLLTGSMYVSMHEIIHSPEAAADLVEGAVEQWDNMLPCYILTLVVTLFQAVSWGLFARGVNDVRDMTRGRLPSRNAFTPAAAVCALTTGLMLCNTVLNVMMAWGNAEGVGVALVNSLPELAVYFACAQLCRQSAAARNGVRTL